LLHFAPRVIAHIAVRFEPPIEHIVAKTDEHVVLRCPNVEFVTIAA
jgi:hypothetical protein